MMNKLQQLAVGTAIAVAVANPAAAAGSGGYYMPHMWEGGHGGFMGPLMMILFLALVVVVVVLVVRWLGGAHGAAPPAKAPLDILHERFARGEVDKDDYEERRRLLGG